MAINLIPQEQESEVSQDNAIRRGIFFGILVVALSFFSLLFVYYYDDNNLKQLSDREDTIKEQEEDLKKYKVSLEKYKNHPALQVLSNHTYHTEFLKVFEECVLPNMYISSIKIDANNKVTVSAEVGKTVNGQFVAGKYADVARFMKTLREKEMSFSSSNTKSKVFSNIKVGSLTKSEGSGQVIFNIDFEFSKSLILKQ